MQSVLDEYSARKSGNGGPIGIPTGLPHIDSVCGGLPLRAVSILGARPSQGKTALASCIALAALHAGHPVIFFSHEMAALDIGQRMACQEQRLSFSHVRAGKLSGAGESKLAAAQKWISRAPLHIIDTGGPSPLDCRNTAMYIINKYRGRALPPLIIVDYIQLEHIKGWKNPNRYEEITEISATWIETAKITGAAVLCLAQLNRQADGSQPVMSQLKESGALEQDANLVMLLWRPAKDRPQDKQDVEMQPGNRKTAGVNWGILSVAKSRNSDLTEQELYWEGYCMRYRAWNPATDSHLSKKDALRQEYNACLADILNSTAEQQPPPPESFHNFGE